MLRAYGGGGGGWGWSEEQQLAEEKNQAEGSGGEKSAGDTNSIPSFFKIS